MYFRSALEIHIMSLGANKVCIFPPVRGSWCGPQASFWSLSCLKPAFPRAEQAPETHTLRSHQAGAGRTPGGPFANSDLSTDLQGSGATHGRAHPRGQRDPSALQNGQTPSPASRNSHSWQFRCRLAGGPATPGHMKDNAWPKP